MSEKTEWYPEGVTPVHEGLYETRVGGGLTWSIWKEGFWHFASTECREAIWRATLGQRSFWQEREWRGQTAPK